MVKNRIIALAYRISAIIIIAIGLTGGSGFTSGPVRFLYYTQQSNIIILLLFVYLSVRTLIDLIKKGRPGSASYSPRLEMSLMIMIIFTFIIFWCVLVPFSGDTPLTLWSYSNLVLHLFTPLLTVADYILFCESGHFKKRDILLCTLLPVAYVVETTTLGLSGLVFYIQDGIKYYFPYLFMDFHVLGGYAGLIIGGIAVAYMGLAALVRLFDRRRKQKVLIADRPKRIARLSAHKRKTQKQA